MDAAAEVYKNELLRELDRVTHKKEKYCKIVRDAEEDLEHYLYLIDKCECKIEKYTQKIVAKLEDIKRIRQLLDAMETRAGAEENLKENGDLKPAT